MTVILGGDIVMSKKEGIAPIKFGFKPTEHDYHLPMFLSSSSVNQLHSPLLAEAVNNYIHLFWLKSQSVDVNPIVADDYPDINPDIHLTTDDIAIYFFKKTRIIPYERGEYGVLFSDFNACSRKIKKISLALTDKVYQLLNDDDEE
jgi:hypothetical protein